MLIFLYNMIHSWVRGPHAPANPWRAHSIEWQVSSPPPLFNFDEIPQVVGGPYEYGVPGARHAVWSRGRRRRGSCLRWPAEKEEEEVRRVTHVLVVANETVAGKSLIEALEQRAKEGPVRDHRDLPGFLAASGYVVYEDTRRAPARRRLDRTLDLLRKRRDRRRRASSSTPTPSTSSVTRLAQLVPRLTPWSSPRTRRRAPVGCAATSSSASAQQWTFPSSTSSSISPQRMVQTTCS